MKLQNHTMATESTNSSSERQTHRQLDRELSEMTSQLSSRLGQLRRAQEDHDEIDEDNGVRIITLAGTNTGATLKSELGEHNLRHHHAIIKGMQLRSCLT